MTKPSIERRSPVLEYVEHLYEEFVGVTEGKVATYIPELAKARPELFGICLVTANGVVYEAGDSRLPFTIQSISKPFVYGLALEDNGRAHVLSKVGVEPTGDAFNSISLEPGSGRPRNPMINAGAIATTGLIAGKHAQHKFQRVLESLSGYAGRMLTIDEAVYKSESDTGHRNRAIGHMLRNFDILTEDPTPIVEMYFRQCSIQVDCRDLGMMAATLANRGINPVTGQQALRGEYVESVMSVMSSCGMYDYAGGWIYEIGMPAKSGVAGGIIAVLPGQLGIGVFSPPLDPRGNSVRGMRVCDALSRHWDLHLFNRPGLGKTAIRTQFTGAEVSSKRERSPEERAVLREHGARIRVFQLQGNLTFADGEVVVHEIVEKLPALDYLILDFKRVLGLNESACRLFWKVLCQCSELSKPVLFTSIHGLPVLKRYMKAKLGARYCELLKPLDDNDLALEWCEQQLLEKLLPAHTPDCTVAARHYELLAELTDAQLAAVLPFLRRQQYKAAEVIIQIGGEPDTMFFLARGRASVMVSQASGHPKRLATFSAGMTFGEMAVLDRARRSATVVADTEVECDVLSLQDFEALGQSYPEIKIKLLEGLALSLCQRLRRVTRELAAVNE